MKKIYITNVGQYLMKEHQNKLKHVKKLFELNINFLFDVVFTEPWLNFSYV